ncbi:hypothetical protein XA68_14547 [Ophiocordyceps unilateralis]|uniref:Uncharacterized protein n=1 Tax=Ophiocordyceps unilateralis TaxID=268505 RepID=A0A2A9PA81_OPHUN|nr:hypothetical protein XA68_14547 [Ophiocordyceps unilateralis]
MPRTSIVRPIRPQANALDVVSQPSNPTHTHIYTPSSFPSFSFPTPLFASATHRRERRGERHGEKTQTSARDGPSAESPRPPEKPKLEK